MTLTAFPQRTTPTPALIATTRSEALYVIRLHGTLDETACEEFELQLAEAEASNAQRILLDLDGLEDLDARALHVILRASRRSAHNGDRLRTSRGKGHVAAIFRLTALDQTLPFDE